MTRVQCGNETEPGKVLCATCAARQSKREDNSRTSEVAPPAGRSLPELEDYAARLGKNGRSRPEVELALVRSGVPSSMAEEIAARHSKPVAGSYALSSAASERRQRDMVVGALVCGVGLVVTIGTYASAGPGESYFVAWGAIVFGAIRFFRGMTS